MIGTVAEPLDPERLVALLSEQRDLYRRLRALGGRQRAQITGDRGDHLLNTLEERSVLVSAVAERSQILGPYLRDWDSVYASLPDGLRTLAAALLQEVTGLVGTILSSDREDEALLVARKQALAEDLREVTDGRAAHAAYGAQATVLAGTLESDVRA